MKTRHRGLKLVTTGTPWCSGSHGYLGTPAWCFATDRNIFSISYPVTGRYDILSNIYLSRNSSLVSQVSPHKISCGDCQDGPRWQTKVHTGLCGRVPRGGAGRRGSTQDNLCHRMGTLPIPAGSTRLSFLGGQLHKTH